MATFTQIRKKGSNKMKIMVTPLVRGTTGIEKLTPLMTEAPNARTLVAAMIKEGVREARLVERIAVAPERIRIMFGRILVV